MSIQIEIKKGRVPVKIWTRDIDATALQQLLNIAQLPIVHGHIAAMPDVHAGIGATVGSVIPTRQAIIPAAVGVDIGCGMNAIRTSLTAEQLPDGLHPDRMQAPPAPHRARSRPARRVRRPAYRVPHWPVPRPG